MHIRSVIPVILLAALLLGFASCATPAPQPDVPAEVPDVPAEVPEAPAEVPDVPAEVPEAPAEVPDVPAEVPEAPAEVPDVPAEVPDVPAEVPEALAEVPEALAEVPEAGEDAVEDEAEVVTPSPEDTATEGQLEASEVIAAEPTEGGVVSASEEPAPVVVEELVEEAEVGVKAPAEAVPEIPAVTEIILLATGDVHGYLLPFDYIYDKPIDTSIAQVHAYAEDVRKGAPDLLLLDTGNTLQGQPAVYYYNNVKTDHRHITADVMEKMHYDAGSVGFYDFGTGPGVVEKVAGELGHPWLAANVVRESDRELPFQPMAVFERSGLTIAVIGLLDHDIGELLSRDTLGGIEIVEPAPVAVRWLAGPEAAAADLVVGIYNTAPAAMEIQLADIRQFAAATAGFDLIIAGGISSGMLFQATDSRGEKVTIVSPGEHAASVADVRFLLQETASGFTLETVTASIIPMEGISYRDAAIAGYEAISDEIEQYISRELGSISQTISAGFSYLGDSAFMDLIHQLQLDLTGADISFAAPSAMDARIEQGVVTVQDLFRLFPFETQLYVLELTGREIDAYLEYSYARWITAMQDTDTLAAEIAACDSAAGIVYTVDPNGMEGERVAVTGVLSPYEYGSEPKPFNPDGTYLVVVPSFRGQGGGGHLTEGAGLEREELQERIQYATLQDVRLYAMRLFEYSGTYQPFCDENWTFLP